MSSVILPLLQQGDSYDDDDLVDVEPWEFVSDDESDEIEIVNTGFTAMFLYHFWANFNQPAWRMAAEWEESYAIPMWASKVRSRNELLGPMTTCPPRRVQLPLEFQIIAVYNTESDSIDALFQSIDAFSATVVVGYPYVYKISVQHIRPYHSFYRPFGVYEEYHNSIYRLRNGQLGSHNRYLPHLTGVFRGAFLMERAEVHINNRAQHALHRWRQYSIWPNLLR